MTRTWDGSPETERDRRFFDLRESGYRGPIDQDGNAADPTSEAAGILRRMAERRERTWIGEQDRE